MEHQRDQGKREKVKMAHVSGDLRDDLKSEPSTKPWLLWVMLSGVFVVVVIYGFIIVNINIPGDIEVAAKRGQFGDMFGAINALFTGLAFAGFIYTIYLQRKDLSLQRMDLRLQRDELELTRREFERAADNQAFPESLNWQIHNAHQVSSLSRLLQPLPGHDISHVIPAPSALLDVDDAHPADRDRTGIPATV